MALRPLIAVLEPLPFLSGVERQRRIATREHQAGSFMHDWDAHGGISAEHPKSAGFLKTAILLAFRKLGFREEQLHRHPQCLCDGGQLIVWNRPFAAFNFGDL
jgi:hypothetical protein